MNNDNPHREGLVEQACNAWRPRDRNGVVLGHPAWFNLDEPGRIEVYEATVKLRQMEAALDPRGLSTTGRLVLNRVMGARS